MVPCVLAALLVTAVAPVTPETLRYPLTRKGDVVDDYFGTRVPDPYRWLEDDSSPQTAAWVKAQREVTEAWLGAIPQRQALAARLTQLWSFERFSPPIVRGKRWFYTYNSGLQPQAALWVTEDPAAPGRLLLDPNGLSRDGTVALAGSSPSEDGRLLAYALSEAGSDWTTWHVRDVETGRDLPDELRWCKSGSASWRRDGSGFYYSRFDEPKAGEALKGVTQNQKVYFHALGTPQAKDALVFARPDQPEWYLHASVTDDDRWLVIRASHGTRPETALFVQDLKKTGSKVEPLLAAMDARYRVVDSEGDTFVVLTNKDAPRQRLVSLSHGKAAVGEWHELIAQGAGRDVLEDVTAVNGRFVAVWMRDAHSVVEVYDTTGKRLAGVDLPTLGTVRGVLGRRTDHDAYWVFTSYLTPPSVFRLDGAALTTTVFRQPKVPFEASPYETEQVFYTSKDGTQVPMFLTHKKGLAKNGQNPTLLYGYGGFNISMTPSFSVNAAAWLELGGIYAVANLRGGGEYGLEWYDAGRLNNKQNVFDDFIAAAEYLTKSGWTSTPKLAIQGGSNGGLLVGACLTQRPDLFGAAVPQVGVMDMLRFHRFTLGWGWTSDYGSADTPEGFEILRRYSPLHNIKAGVKYPPTLVVTADHDDRVVPAHSFKFTATLQAAQAGTAPILARIETRAGHGAGKPTQKSIEEGADILAFLVRALGVGVP